MSTIESNYKPIAGCARIGESIHQSIFADHYEALARSVDSEIGTRPKQMPSPFTKPMEHYANATNIRPKIDGLPLTWLEVRRESRWGVYFSVIALYGDRHWVTRDQSGAMFLRVYEEPFG